MNLLYAGYPWRFTHFRKTNGYANMPLDGVWLRAPYLHNGSAPSLRDLLEPPEARPKTFYRGYDVYDSREGGVRFDRRRGRRQEVFSFTTPACRAMETADICTGLGFRPPTKTRLSST